MLPRERVMTTLDHREPDRIPWGEHLIDFNIYEAVLGRKSFVNSHFYETQAYWEGRRDEVIAHYKRDLPDLAEALGLDIVTLPGGLPPAGHAPEPMEKVDDETYRAANGALYRVSGGCWLLPYRRADASTYVEPTVQSVDEEIEKARAQPDIDITDSAWEVHRYIVERMKGTHYIAMLIGGMTFPKFGPTAEDAWISMLEKPEVCARISMLRAVNSQRQIRAAAALGVDAVLPCGDLGNSANLDASPATYRQLVYPAQKLQVDAARELGLKALLHCCGHVMPIIDDIADLYDAYEAIQTSAGMDIRVLKERVGDRLTLWGGILHEHLIGGTPEDIRADARYSFAHAAPRGGYILGSSHSLAVGAKMENVMAMKRCRDEWGTYPIRAPYS